MKSRVEDNKPLYFLQTGFEALIKRKVLVVDLLGILRDSLGAMPMPQKIEFFIGNQVLDFFSTYFNPYYACSL